MTANFEAINFVLSTVATNDHTAENMSEEILAMIRKWKLDEKVLGLVGDNTASMPKTGLLIAEEKGFASFQYWGCVGHILHLVVKHTLEMVRYYYYYYYYYYY
jgi:hypothetical protein